MLLYKETKAEFPSPNNLRQILAVFDMFLLRIFLSVFKQMRTGAERNKREGSKRAKDL